MINNILSRREESNTYLTHVCRHRRSRHHDENGAFSQHLSLQLIKVTVLAESSGFIRLHCGLSALAMSTDMSQVGGTLLPSV